MQQNIDPSSLSARIEERKKTRRNKLYLYAWVFNPSWPLAGKSIEEMKTNFGQRRDKEFASHVCAEHPRVAKNPAGMDHLCVVANQGVFDGKGLAEFESVEAFSGRRSHGMA